MLTVLLMAIKKEAFLYAVRGSLSDSGALLSKGAIFLHAWNNKSLALNFDKPWWVCIRSNMQPYGIHLAYQDEVRCNNLSRPAFLKQTVPH